MEKLKPQSWPLSLGEVSGDDDGDDWWFVIKIYNSLATNKYYCHDPKSGAHEFCVVTILYSKTHS